MCPMHGTVWGDATMNSTSLIITYCIHLSNHHTVFKNKNKYCALVKIFIKNWKAPNSSGYAKYWKSIQMTN